MTWTHGHHYSDGDVIFGYFTDERGEEHYRLVRFVRRGVGCAYIDRHGQPTDIDWELGRWRPASDEEYEAFEGIDPEDDPEDEDDPGDSGWVTP